MMAYQHEEDLRRAKRENESLRLDVDRLQRELRTAAHENGAQAQQLRNAAARIHQLEAVIRGALVAIESVEPGVSSDCEPVHPELVDAFNDLDRAVRS